MAAKVEMPRTDQIAQLDVAALQGNGEPKEGCQRNAERQRRRRTQQLPERADARSLRRENRMPHRVSCQHAKQGESKQVM
jgi:hypothetical protein